MNALALAFAISGIIAPLAKFGVEPEGLALGPALVALWIASALLLHLLAHFTLDLLQDEV